MEDEYDEFGNYIGPGDQSLSPEPTTQQPSWMDDELKPRDELEDARMEIVEEASLLQNQIILHEDKQYYPSAEEVYGPGVETLVQEEDTQLLTEPVIAPIQKKHLDYKEADIPETRYSKQFLLELTQYPEYIRNICLVGHLHHGKTTFLDNLVEQTHLIDWQIGTKYEKKNQRYTDIYQLERDRGMSLKCQPMSLVMSDLKGKSHLLNILDTPGHIDFLGEVSAGLRLADGAVLVVDIVEGMTATNEKILKLILQENLPITLLINKIDRLILELKFPPEDAYYKIKNVIDEVNHFILLFSQNENLRVSPELGNVCFGSSQFNFVFSLLSVSCKYAEKWKSKNFNVEQFAIRLWGDVYYNPKNKGFLRKPVSADMERTFCYFILNPLYKLFTQTLSASEKELKQTLTQLQIPYKQSLFDLDIKPMLQTVLKSFFGDASAFVQMISQHLPSPVEGAPTKLQKFTGPSDSLLGRAIQECDPEGPLLIQVVKIYPALEDTSKLNALGRIFSGTVHDQQRVCVLGESFSEEEDDDFSLQQISALFMHQTRYKLPVNRLSAGNLVLLEGIEETIYKTATIIDSKQKDDVYAMLPLHHNSQPCLKVAIEPLQPSELPKMLEGLRKLNKTYPMIQSRVEESGEHILIGNGEMHLDCALTDLRTLFSKIEIRVSDPSVRFQETIVETSAMKCLAETPNKKNQLGMICEPLQKQLVSDLEAGLVPLPETKELPSLLEQKYNWDLLASRSVWAFGPDPRLGPNLLLDDSLPDEVDKKLLYSVRESIQQGFQWATREGPLCDEPIRQVKYKILDAVLSKDSIHRGAGQVIPTARRLCYASFLLATPRLMEPVYSVEIQAPSDCLPAIEQLLTRRRGHVTQEQPKSGSPLSVIKAYLPIMDSFGFETDLRVHTHGQAFSQQVFDHWQIVPGDPLDTSIELKPLQPSINQHLARDFMIKTRRRKGLNEEVSLSKYLDDQMLMELAKHDILMGTQWLQ